MGTLQVGGTTLGVKNTSTNKIDLSNVGDITKDSLPMYACRAWVNVDTTKNSTGGSDSATSNRFIRASGNVTNVYRNGTGDYTVYFTTNLPSNYVAVGNGYGFGGSRSLPRIVSFNSSSSSEYNASETYDVASIRVMVYQNDSSSTKAETEHLHLVFFG